MWEGSSPSGDLQCKSSNRTIYAQVLDASPGAAINEKVTVDSKVFGNHYQALKTCPDGSVAYLSMGTTSTSVQVFLVDEEVEYGMHLAFKEGRRGKLLARHSVMQYFRQAKNWLLEQFPQHRTKDKSLLKKGQVLERHCMKRESGAFVNKAPACAKSALKRMMVYLYSTAVIPADYQDAALLCLLWFLLGRASDLTLLRKVNLSIGSGDIFFVRFIHIKTSEEQGLSLFPDEDFATCPILAIAVALATQAAPGVALLSQIPAQAVSTQSEIAPATPLIDLLDHPEPMTSSQPAANSEKSEDAAPGVHSYINRVLDRFMGKAGVAEHLTSHSFRWGGRSTPTELACAHSGSSIEALGT
ncbi:Hypothetical protein PHPALM_10369 [Phytophthora palmivora]|uniref:Uncharacterized protein n=1 Tax=Phytophthora palmivora TaxID=4796 RepID=A0A2P4Y4Y6_9STRA|nr:Hypothetical protein PHPALM_10369 [Phytophthora palmivora]